MGRRKKKAALADSEYVPQSNSPVSLDDSEYVPREHRGEHRSKTHIDVIEGLEHATGSHVFCAMILDRVEDLEEQLLSVQHTDRHLHMDQLLGNKEEIKLLKCELAEHRARYEMSVARCSANEQEIQTLRGKISEDREPATWQLVLLLTLTQRPSMYLSSKIDNSQQLSKTDR